MYIGKPVAFFVSEPKLWESTCQNNGGRKNQFERVSKETEKIENLHQAIMSPIMVYVPLVMQNVAKYRTCMFSWTERSNLRIKDGKIQIGQ
jgi:hypothetical protein